VADRTFERLGADLALTHYVGTESALRLDVADSWGSVDLAVVPGRSTGRPAADRSDLGAVAGRENLAQALILRLLTPLGGLSGLGHPGFGSRLGALIGRGNDDTTRHLARLYTLEALAQEPRIHRPVRDLSVEVLPGSPDTVRIGFSVVPVGDQEPLAVTLEVTP
jgi:phage baseplate assembly protein W